MLDAKARIDIHIRGDRDRFLQAAAWTGLSLGQVRPAADGLFAQALAADRGKLRRALRLSGCTLHIQRRRGLPFLLAFLQRRPALPLMALALVAALFLTSSLIFRVEVVSQTPLPAAALSRVRQAAAEGGLVPGRFIWQVDLERVRGEIVRACPELFFVEPRRRGVTLELRVAKRLSVEPAQQRPAPGDLVAAADGVILEVLVRRGTAAVQPGDTVVRGQVLVYGWQGLEGPVAADALVQARVWATGYGECPLTRRELRPTGRRALCLALRGEKGNVLTLLGEREKYLYAEPDLSTVAWKPWRNMKGPVEVIYGRVDELEAQVRSYSEQQAAAIAARDAELRARARLTANSDLSATSVQEIRRERLDLEPELVRVRVTLEARSEIGQAQPHLWSADPSADSLPE